MSSCFFLFRENKWVNELQERRSRGTFFFIILGGGGDKEQANGGVIYVYYIAMPASVQTEMIT